MLAFLDATLHSSKETIQEILLYEDNKEKQQQSTQAGWVRDHGTQWFFEPLRAEDGSWTCQPSRYGTEGGPVVARVVLIAHDKPMVGFFTLLRNGTRWDLDIFWDECMDCMAEAIDGVSLAYIEGQIGRRLQKLVTERLIHANDKHKSVTLKTN